MYRTLPHEFGHWKHFFEEVGDLGSLLKGGKTDAEMDAVVEAYKMREDIYHRIPTDEKERYAHRFADEFKQMLEECRMIPFDRIEDKTGEY